MESYHRILTRLANGIFSFPTNILFSNKKFFSSSPTGLFLFPKECSFFQNNDPFFSQWKVTFIEWNDSLLLNNLFLTECFFHNKMLHFMKECSQSLGMILIYWNVSLYHNFRLFSHKYFLATQCLFTDY